MSTKLERELRRGYLLGLEAAAQKAENWGDQCAGGSGREIISEGPSKGQMYGQAYYNLAESIRKIDPEKGY